MPEFRWEPDIERGEWLRPMEEEPFTSLLSTVPRGFEMYARLFHPIERDRPRATKTWTGVDEGTFFDDADDLETEPASWAQAAASFGTTMHAEALYHRLLRRYYGDTHGVIAPDGWRYGDSQEGCLDVESLAIAAQVLARHTSTPATGIAAIWEGRGHFEPSRAVSYLTGTSFTLPTLLRPFTRQKMKNETDPFREMLRTAPPL